MALKDSQALQLVLEWLVDIERPKSYGVIFGSGEHQGGVVQLKTQDYVGVTLVEFEITALQVDQLNCF